MRTFTICLLCILGTSADLDTRFSVDTKELQLNEMAQSIQQISGAVMGIAEFVVEIKNDVKKVREEVAEHKSKIKPDHSIGRNEFDPLDAKENERTRMKNAILADKVEKLLAVENNSQVNAAKDEMKKILEVNFIKFLSAMLVTGPMTMTPEKATDILKLMKAVLNGEVDFTPVVQKLPFIMRDSETNQIILMMQTLYENEQPREFRQGQTQTQPQTQKPIQSQPVQITPVQPVRVTMKPQTGLEKILEAMSQLNVEQVAGFLQFLPGFFESIGSIVDGVTDL